LSRPSERCSACAAPALVFRRRLTRGESILRCDRCGHRELRNSALRPESDEFAGLDPEAYRRAMSVERRSAASAILRGLLAAGAEGPLLDVGCSFGWLLEVAEDHGFEAYGVDPSASAVADARSRGLRVRRGHFPSEDWGRRDWGVIAYMDVLEHIPDLDTMLSETLVRLRPGGLVAVQVPDSTGVVFRAADAVERWSLGIASGPLRRMFQTDFPYPHLHYFNRRSLEALFARFGLRSVWVSAGAIATENFAERVTFRNDANFAEQAQAIALRLLVAAGRATGMQDLLRVIARH